MEPPRAEGRGVRFYFHAIVSTGGNCSGDPGQEYLDLATATGGEMLSVCAADWTALFAQLEEAVIASAPLPCEFDIPDPPSGQTFSPSEVSVGFTPRGECENVYPKASGPEMCGDELGWHFDDESNPSQIIFCPAACTQVQTTAGDLGIKFGCQPPVLL